MTSHGLAHLMVTSSILGVIILMTIIGNVFVIAAIVIEKNLQNVANYLISSLAVADLMVAALVMPLAAVNEVNTRWFLGPIVCDIWTFFDVLCCTSSILHLVAISLDRYWAVNRVDYIHNRSAKRIIIMIALSWIISAIISMPPLFGWKGPEIEIGNHTETDECIISQDWGYTVFSTLGAFYIPLVFMLIIYLSVYQTARSRIRKDHFAKGRKAKPKTPDRDTNAGAGTGNSGAGNTGSTETGSALPIDVNKSPPKIQTPVISITVDRHHSIGNGSALTATASATEIAHPVMSTSASAVVISDMPAIGHGPGLSAFGSLSGLNFNRKSGSSRLEVGSNMTSSRSMSGLSAFGSRGSWLDLSRLHLGGGEKQSTKTAEEKAKEKREQRRERKAARTLAIITGSFIVCWLPFFILALVRPFCGENCKYPVILTSVIGWLGYFNSLLNPIIYTVFNPDFRLAFKKILLGKYRYRAQQQLQKRQQYQQQQQQQQQQQTISSVIITSAT